MHRGISAYGVGVGLVHNARWSSISGPAALTLTLTVILGPTVLTVGMDG